MNKEQNMKGNKVSVSNEEKRLILKERARAMAEETGDKKPEQGRTEIIVFRLATEIYGFETAFVREAFQLKDYTPLPGTSPFVLGVVNVRGQILSVLDFRKFFNLVGNGLGELNKLIIIHNNEMEFGVLTDEIIGIRNIVPGELQQSLPTLHGLKEEYIKGITADRLIVLDADKILSDKNIIVNEEVK